MRLLVAFFLVLTPFHLQAQTYKGKVIDTYKKEMSGVSVIIYDGNDKTVAYTYTSISGDFSISDKEKRGDKIVFSYMGYAKRILPLSAFSSPQIVELEEAPFSLQEIKVRPEKIRERGDTLVYNVSSFVQGQDRSIADVIKKMPGLNVGENGQITFEGKPISKFYIEGMDLMGNKYSQASENLQASKIKNVQIISNHQDVKTLRGVEFSDQAALNIVLKDEVKSAWFGVIESGIGIQDDSHTDRTLYEGKLMGMLFSRKMQNLSMYKCNNVGKDITDEVKDLTPLSRESYTLKGLVKKMTVDVPDIGKEQTYFNTSHLIATNQLFKTKRGNELRFQMDYLWNKEHTRVCAETYYTDISGTKITEEDSIATTKSRLNGEISYKINNDNLYFTNNLYGSIDFDQADGIAFLNGKKITQYARPRKMYVAEEFNLIKNNSVGGKIGLSSITTYGCQPEQLLTVLESTERLKIYSFYHQNNISYRMRVRHFTINSQAGFSILHQKMRINNLNTDTVEKYQQYDINLTPSVIYEHNKLKFSLIAKVNTALRHYEGENYTRISLQPTIFAQYNMSKFLEVKLNYNYSETTKSLLTIYRTPIFTSYRTQQTYGGQLKDIGLHMLHLTLYYKQPIKRLFAGISTLWLHRHNEVVFRSHLINDVYLRTPTTYYYNPNMYECNLFASHSLYWGKTTIAADVTFGKNDYTLLYKDVLEKCYIYSVNSNLKIASQPFKNLSFELNSSISINKQSPLQNTELPSIRILYYKHRISTSFFPSKNWEICMRSSIYHSPIKTISNNFFIGAYVSYKVKHAEFQFSCKNLLNNTHYNQTNIETNLNSYASYTLRPREFMAKVIFDL